ALAKAKERVKRAQEQYNGKHNQATREIERAKQEIREVFGDASRDGKGRGSRQIQRIDDELKEITDGARRPIDAAPKQAPGKVRPHRPRRERQVRHPDG